MWWSEEPQLRLLGHVACKPERSVGGQKRQWNDVIVGDLKKCEMSLNWCKLAQNCSIWRGWTKPAAEDVNEEMEIVEQSKKHELKQRREAVCKPGADAEWLEVQ